MNDLPELLDQLDQQLFCLTSRLGGWGRVKRAPSVFRLGAHCVRPQPPAGLV